MGDVVYPGIVITRVFKHVTESDVQQYIKQGLCIGKYYFYKTIPVSIGYLSNFVLLFCRNATITGWKGKG